MRRLIKRPWTPADERMLRRAIREQWPVTVLSRTMKRTPSALYQRAHSMGVTFRR